jgi:hypothetical protein
MTPEEYKKDRHGLIRDYRYLVIQWLEGARKEEPSIEEFEKELDALDAEYAASQKAANPFYAFLVQLDADYKAIKSGQGSTPRLLTAINHAMATLSAYAEYLKEGK